MDVGGGGSMIFVTGDTHAGWMERLNTNAFPEQKTMTKDDYVIVLGDFGIWDDSRRERYALDWLEQKSFTTLFISGNHENYDMLDAMPVEEWNGGKVNFIRPSVIHLMRGQVFTIAGKKFFTFGGASSHDISDGILEPMEPDFKRKKKLLDKDPYSMYRINHETWWERELPNEEEMEAGRKNLNANGNQVDFILTHSPCTSVLRQMDGRANEYESDRLTDYLQEIRETTVYGHWLFGHMHVNQMFNEDHAICIYEQIIRIA